MTKTTEQLPGHEHIKECECGHCPEQPSAIIVKTIQGLLEVVNTNLTKLDELAMGNTAHKVLVRQAFEDIDNFQKTTLFELQKAFE